MGLAIAKDLVERPGVDVWALAAKLQKRHPTPGVLMTLVHEHVDTEVLRAHGFHGHLTKPLAPTHLRAIEIIRCGASVEAPEDVQTHAMDRLALGGIRVLVAEDHPVNRTVVVSILADRLRRDRSDERTKSSGAPQI